VAVIVDRDGKDAERDEPHLSIARACKVAGVPFIEAVEAFAAWHSPTWMAARQEPGANDVEL